MDRQRRRALRAALLATEPWLAETDRGPQAVEAGPCDRCGDRPRLLPTCGPDGSPGLCQGCAATIGTDAWCDGHLDEAHAALAWAASLPAHVDTAVTLWWVATGEVRLDDRTPVPDHPALPASVRDLLGGGSPDAT